MGTKIQEHSKKIGTKVKKIREQNPGTKISKIWEQKLQKIWEQKLQKYGN
jgi:hypothetical protein